MTAVRIKVFFIAVTSWQLGCYSACCKSNTNFQVIEKRRDLANEKDWHVILTRQNLPGTRRLPLILKQINVEMREEVEAGSKNYPITKLQNYPIVSLDHGQTARGSADGFLLPVGG